MINIYVATIFPELFPGPCEISLLKKAIKNKIWSLNIINIRNFAINKRIDDKIFGGIPGMLLKPQVIEEIINFYKHINWNKILYTNPSGNILNQKYLINLKNIIIDHQLKNEDYNILIISGRYEGIDARVVEYYKMEEFSLGEFILCGGEIPVMAFIEGLIRLFPGVLGNIKSLEDESFIEDGKFQYKKYTRPRVWNGIEVPEVLFNGNHKKIKEWKKK
jgi:tRNA (guanine37-N1)-methyltransferase